MYYQSRIAYCFRMAMGLASTHSPRNVRNPVLSRWMPSH